LASRSIKNIAFTRYHNNVLLSNSCQLLNGNILCNNNETYNSIELFVYLFLEPNGQQPITDSASNNNRNSWLKQTNKYFIKPKPII
jgi:hypothetical protein